MWQCPRCGNYLKEHQRTVIQQDVFLACHYCGVVVCTKLEYEEPTKITFKQGSKNAMSQAIEQIAKEEYVPSTGLSAISRGCGTPVEAELVKELFEFHAWTPAMIEEGKAVRESLASAYELILAMVPCSASRTRALNCLTDCRMLVNTAITFKGAV